LLDQLVTSSSTHRINDYLGVLWLKRELLVVLVLLPTSKDALLAQQLRQRRRTGLVKYGITATYVSSSLLLHFSDRNTVRKDAEMDRETGQQLCAWL